MPMPMGMSGQLPLQSQIETALSLPRPDPTALWLAQQSAGKRGQRKNNGVMIAVVMLTVLCIIGIGVLFYFRMRGAAPTPVPAPVTTEAAPATGNAAAAPTSAPTATPVGARFAPTQSAAYREK
jgi:serine/threonine-protein kinase